MMEEGGEEVWGKEITSFRMLFVWLRVITISKSAKKTSLSPLFPSPPLSLFITLLPREKFKRSEIKFFFFL